MFGSAILDTVIGLVLVFLIFSLIASALREVVEQVVKLRAVDLERGIGELLAGKNPALLQRIYTHPFVSALYRGEYSSKMAKRDLPSYIPLSNFALALMDEVVRGRKDGTFDATAAAPVITLLELRRSVANIDNANVQRVILSALDTAQGDLGRAQETIEAWYNSAMDRVSGRYKKRTQFVLLIIGMLIAMVGNVNPVRIARYLYHDKTARDVVVAEAGAVAKDPSISNARPDSLLARVDKLNLPMGWPQGLWKGVEVEATTTAPGTVDGLNLIIAVAGWMMTALAISFGAPFWFDLLNRMMVIRSTVKPHEKSPEEGSEDGRSNTKIPRLGASGGRLGGQGARGSGNEPGIQGAGEPPSLEVPNTWKDGTSEGDL